MNRLVRSSLRSREKSYKPNDGTRSVYASSVAPEVAETLKLWERNLPTQFKNKCVLVGGLALSYYAKPRYTEDADFLFLEEKDIPTEVNGFRKPPKRKAFEEKKTQVLVETITPHSFKPPIPDSIAKKVMDTAVQKGSLRIASLEGLVALKLCSSRLRDYADIVDLLNSTDSTPDMSNWHLDSTKLSKYKELTRQAESERT